MKRNLIYSLFFVGYCVSNICFSQTVFNNLYNNNNASSGRANAVIQTIDSCFITIAVTNNVSAWYIIKTDLNGDTLWELIYDYVKGSFTNAGELTFSVIQLQDSNYIISGFDYDSLEGASDSHLLKLKQDGKIIWEKVIEGGFNDRSYDVKQTKDSGLIIVGWNYDSTASTSQVILMKTDSSGNKQWQQEYGGNAYDFARSIDFTLDSGYILGGTTFSFGLGPYDLYLIKTDSAGNFQWQKTFGDSLRDYGNSVVTTSDGGYVLVGASEVSIGNYEAYIVKTDSAGNIEWERTFGRGPEYDEFTKVKILPDGSYIACGNTLDYSGTRNKPVGFIMKISPNGDSLWSRTYDYYESDSTDHYFYGMDLTYDGGFVMCGMVINNKSVTKNDVWLVKTDCMGYDTITPAVQAGFTYNNDTIIAGFTFTNLSQYANEYVWYFGDGDSSTAVNPTHVYPDTGSYIVLLIAKGCEEVEKDTVTDTITIILTGTISQTSNGALMKIYPNPANESVTTIDYKLPQDAKDAVICIYNIVGNEVKRYNIDNEQGKINLNTTDLPNGFYFCTLNINKKVVATNKLIILRPR